MTELKKFTDFSTFDELLDLHIGLNFEKRITFFKNIPERYQWSMNINDKRLTIEGVDYTIQQIMGTYSLAANSWVWAWANEQSSFPADSTDKTKELTQTGIAKDILQLKEGHFETGEIFTEKIGLICSGLFDADTHVCINYGKGILVATLKDEKVPKIDFSQTEEIESIFRRIVSEFNPGNTQNALISYLLDRGMKVVAAKDRMEAFYNGELKLPQSRLYELSNLRRVV